MVLGALRAALLRRPAIRAVRPPTTLCVRRVGTLEPGPDALHVRKSKRRQLFERTKDPAFVDRVFMFAAAGTGGDGAVAFSRAKGLPVGPPGGGDGSRGGSIYAQVDASMSSLGHIGNVGSGIPRALTMADEEEFAAQMAEANDEIPVVATVRAPDGEHGKGSDIDGRRVPDRIIRVPPGTVVKVKFLHPSYLANSTDMVKHIERTEGQADKAALPSTEPTDDASTPAAPGQDGPQAVESTDETVSQMTLAQLQSEEDATEQELIEIEAEQAAEEQRSKDAKQVTDDGYNKRPQEEKTQKEKEEKNAIMTDFENRVGSRQRYEDELIYKGFFAKTVTGRRPPLSILKLLAPTVDKDEMRAEIRKFKDQIREGEALEAERLRQKEEDEAAAELRAQAHKARLAGEEPEVEPPPEPEPKEPTPEEEEDAYWAAVHRKRQREWQKSPEGAAAALKEQAEIEARNARMMLFWRYLPRDSTGKDDGLGDLIRSGWQRRTFLESEERAGRLLLQQRHERLRSHLERVRSYRQAAQEHADLMAIHDPRRAIRTEDHMAAWDFVIDLNDVRTANALAEAGGSTVGAEAAGASVGQLSAPILLAQGGMGGMGNVFFYTGRDRSPKIAMRGASGEVIRVMLELKSVGDVGLVGFPNAGKSTLLQALTGADGSNGGRVGGWAFTTLNPSMGILRLGSDGKVLDAGQSVIGDTAKRVRGGTGAAVKSDSTPEARSVLRNAAGPEDHAATDAHDAKYRRLLVAANDQTRAPDVEEVYRIQVADLPGLIEGASVNVGLGHSFLQHIERCALLVFVVDLAGQNDEPPAWEALRVLYNELEAYQPGLAARATMVIANKADQLDRPDGAAEAKATLKRLNEEVRKLHAAQVATATRAGIPPPAQPMTVIPVAAKYRLNVDRVAKTLCDQHKTLTAKEEEDDAGAVETAGTAKEEDDLDI